jgi:hypothetical protein
LSDGRARRPYVLRLQVYPNAGYQRTASTTGMPMSGADGYKRLVLMSTPIWHGEYVWIDVCGWLDRYSEFQGHDVCCTLDCDILLELVDGFYDHSFARAIDWMDTEEQGLSR